MMFKIEQLDRENRLVLPSYVIISLPDASERKAFQCLICRGKPSWNPGDVENLWCAHCRIFHGDIPDYLRLKDIVGQRQQG